MSYKAGSTFAEHVAPKIYFAFHHALIDTILKRKSTLIKVAVATDQQDVIYGYAIFEQLHDYNIFHYIYIKRPFHGFNICDLLLSSAPFEIKSDVFCSHLTKKGLKLLNKYFMQYNPYLI